MDLRQLRYFVAIAETKSLSKAGERLAIAQPALSTQLASMEQELGTRLFDRSSRGVTLTPNGELLLKRAIQILQSVNDAVAELRAKDVSVSGRVRIGLPGTAAGVMATSIVRQVRMKYPNIMLTVMESSLRRLVQLLERDQLDLAVLVNELECSSLDVVELATESFYLFGPAAASDGSTHIDWVELARLPLLLSGPDNTSRKMVDDAARTSGIRLQPVAEIEATHLQKEAVRAGLGYAILPCSSSHDSERDKFWTRRIVNPELRAVMSIACSKVRMTTQAQQAVKETVIGICRELVHSGLWSEAPGGRPD